MNGAGRGRDKFLMKDSRLLTSIPQQRTSEQAHRACVCSQTSGLGVMFSGAGFVFHNGGISSVQHIYSSLLSLGSL